MTRYIPERKYKEIIEQLEKEFPDFRKSFLEEEILVSGNLESLTVDNIIPEEIRDKIAKILNG